MPKVFARPEPVQASGGSCFRADSLAGVSLHEPPFAICPRNTSVSHKSIGIGASILFILTTAHGIIGESSLGTGDTLDGGDRAARRKTGNFRSAILVAHSRYDAQQMSTSIATSRLRQDRLAIEVAPVERVLYWGERIVLAQFSCAPMHPHFCGTGPLKKPVFGFPRKSSSFAVNDASPFLADPTVAVLLSAGDHYRRSKISVDGDRSDIIGIDEALLASVLDSIEPAALDQAGSARFPRTHSPVDAVAYRDVRILIERLTRGYTPLDLEVEECVLVALASVLRNRTPPARPERAHARRRSGQLVKDAKAYLLTNIETSCSLQDIATVANVSPFHLARTFRRETGTTLHKYLLQLKLRSSLDFLAAQDRDITRIALMFGFSSHSHFSDAFRKTFEKSPTSFCDAARKAFD